LTAEFLNRNPIARSYPVTVRCRPQSVLEADEEDHIGAAFYDAEKSQNAWGLFDMHGNICEWCQDCYGPYVAMPSQIDPAGAVFGPGRVVRGGSWFSISQNCRFVCRFYRASNSRCEFVGFRLVREL
jgi:formylglycine-generating enzyme required for sulfatase activity